MKHTDVPRCFAALPCGWAASLYLALFVLSTVSAAEAPPRRLRVDASAAGALAPDAPQAVQGPAAPAGAARLAAANGPVVAPLLHFLEAFASRSTTGANATALPPYKDFLPECVAHVQGVVHSVDRAYTDIQLETVLEHECWLDSKYQSIETGFSKEEACRQFAKRLTAARNKELESGSAEGYEEFCKSYYEHQGGSTVVEKPAEPKKPEAPKKPEEPKEPTEPKKPDEPKEPEKPKEPKEPEEPKEPKKPEEPKEPKEDNATKTEASPSPTENSTASVSEKQKEAEQEEAKAESQAIYDKTYKEQLEKGKSKEEAKKEAEKAVEDAEEKAKEVGRFPWTAVSVIIGMIVSFVIGGLVMRSMKRR